MGAVRLGHNGDERVGLVVGADVEDDGGASQSSISRGLRGRGRGGGGFLVPAGAGLDVEEEVMGRSSRWVSWLRALAPISRMRLPPAPMRMALWPGRLT